MKIHKKAIQELFTSNDKVLDAEEVLELGREPGVNRHRGPRRRHRPGDEQPRPALAGRRRGRRPGPADARGAPRRPRRAGLDAPPLGADRPDRRAVGLRPAAGPGRGVDRGATSSRCRWSGPTSAGADVGVDRLPVVGPRLGRLGAARSSSCPGGDPPADDPGAPQGQHDRPGDRRQGGRRRAGAPGRRARPRAGAWRRRRSRSSSSARPSRRSWSSTAGGSSTPRPARAGRSGCGRGAAGTARSPTGARRSRRTTCSAAAWSTSARMAPTPSASR